MTRWFTLCLWLASVPFVALGQQPAEVPSSEVGLDGIVPGPPPPADEVDERARQIGLELRCPVCQGLSVADSTSSAAVAMQNRIRELVANGYTKEQIDGYFVSKYGEWVLLNPTRDGINIIVWVGPALAFLLGIGVVTTLSQASKEEDEEVDSRLASTEAENQYMRQLLAEVEDDELS